MQAQNWAAPPIAIWTRTGQPLELAPALEKGDLVYGFLLRGTLHMTSARQHPSYAAVTEASGATAWQRTKAPPPPAMDHLRRDLYRFAARPKTPAELQEFIEAWIARHKPALDPAELAVQRQYGWRAMLRWTALVRAPEDGRWGRQPPKTQVASPTPPARWPEPAEALTDVVGRHLRAFGPATADDVAQWIGWKPPAVRKALEGMELDRFEDERGRPLFDLPGAPRPGPESEAPPRLLPWFDNVILAYAPGGRARILPDQYRDRLYKRANLQWLPAILVDGMVAGTWTPKTGLQPFTKLARRVTAELEALLAKCPA